jgi:hypothetical protein
MSVANTNGVGRIEYRPTCGVYALVDPRSGRVMYVGQSIDIDYRFRQHVNPNVHDNNMDKWRWIAGLRNAGLVPRLVILAEVDWPESDQVEKDYIRQYRTSGQCELNLAVGGKTNRSVTKLGNARKDDWFQLGRQLKDVREALMNVMTETCRIGTAKDADAIQHVLSKLDVARSRLENRLLREFPEWTDVTKVFYGPNDPREG